MSAEEFRRYGHEVVDFIAEYFSHTERHPVLAQVKPGELRSQLPDFPARAGRADGGDTRGLSTA